MRGRRRGWGPAACDAAGLLRRAVVLADRGPWKRGVRGEWAVVHRAGCRDPLGDSIIDVRRRARARWLPLAGWGLSSARSP